MNRTNDAWLPVHYMRPTGCLSIPVQDWTRLRCRCRQQVSYLVTMGQGYRLVYGLLSLLLFIPLCSSRGLNVNLVYNLFRALLLAVSACGKHRDTILMQ